MIGLLQLPEFFDAPLEEVNILLQFMVLYYPDKTVPEWLRGIHRYEDLPRVSDEPMDYRFSVFLLRPRTIATRMRWAIENLEGPWRLDESGINYARRADALQHKLKWEDDLKDASKVAA